MAYPPGYSNKARSPLPPLGLLYLAGALKQRCEVSVVDMVLSGQTENDLIAILDKYRPELVGITSVYGLWPSVVEMFRLVKRYNPAIRTVVGGPNPTQYPAETLSFSEIDYLITGIGQRPLMLLCEALEQGRSGDGIENCYVQGQVYKEFQTIYSEEYHLDRFPLPDRSAVPFAKYHIGICPENPTTTMVSSMGCPFHCAFCSTHRPNVQIRAVDKVLDEMETIQTLGVRSILFQDELFTLTTKRVDAICEGILQRGIRLNWSVKSRVDSIKSGMPELMKKAGCFNIHFGIESGNDGTLLRMKKGYTLDQVRRTVKMVKDAGLLCTGNFMLAYPGENERDVYRTIEFAHELQLDVTQFSITLLSPGTELFSEAVRTGRQKGDPLSEFTRDLTKIDGLHNYASEVFPPEKLFEFLNIAYAGTRTLFDVSQNDLTRPEHK